VLQSGDLSKILMGGVYEKRGREALRSLVLVPNVTQMYLRALMATTCTSLTDVLKAEEKEDASHNVLINVVDNMPLTKVCYLGFCIFCLMSFSCFFLGFCIFCWNFFLLLFPWEKSFRVEGLSMEFLVLNIGGC